MSKKFDIKSISPFAMSKKFDIKSITPSASHYHGIHKFVLLAPREKVHTLQYYLISSHSAHNKKSPAGAGDSFNL